MAREILPIDRSVYTPSADIQASNVYSKLGEAVSSIGFMAAGLLADRAVEASEQVGALHAEQGRAPEKLMPGITRATRAYNKGVTEAEARTLSLQGREMILGAYARMSDPSSFNSQTPAEFDATVDGIIEGVLENTRNENRAEVRNALSSVASQAKIGMLESAVKYDNKQTMVQFQTEYDAVSELLKEARFTKDRESIKTAENLMNTVLNDYAERNEQIKSQLPEIRKALAEEEKVQTLVADYIESYAQGTQDQFLNNLAKEKPAGYTEDEYLKAASEVLKIDAQNKRLTREQENTSYQQAVFGIYTGQIRSPQEIVNQYGEVLPAADIYKLSSLWVNHNRAQFQKDESVAIVEEARQGGANEVAKLPNKVLNSYYEKKQEDILNEVNANLQPDEPPRTQLSLLERMQLIVAPAGAPIEDFNIDLQYALKGADPAKSADAINAYRYAWSNREIFGDVLKGLDSTADQIAQYTLSLNSKSEVEDLALINQAQENIKDKSDTTRIARSDRLKTFYSMNSGVSEIDSFYKQSFGIWPGTAQFDAHYGAFQKLFDHYFMGVANGDQDVAMKMAQAQMRDWGTSKWGAPNDMMYSPPEKTVAFSNMGYWLDNQMLLGLDQALSALEEQPGSNIKRPKWMKDAIPDGNISQQDLFAKNYSSTTREAAIGLSPGNPAWNFVTDEVLNTEGLLDKRQLSAVIDGIERPVYIASTNNTRTSFNGQTVYQWYYKDDFGVAQYLPDPNNPLGVAQITLEAMNDFIPEVFREINDKDFDAMSKKYAKAEFEQKNPLAWYDHLFGTGEGLGRDIDKYRYVQRNKERIKELFKQARQPNTVENP